MPARGKSILNSLPADLQFIPEIQHFGNYYFYTSADALKFAA